MPPPNTGLTVSSGSEKDINESSQRNIFNLSQLWQSITKSVNDTNDDEPISPINILGTEFDNIEAFESDIKSKICLTYRYGFEPIARADDGPNPLSFLQSVIFSRNLILDNLQNMHTLIDNDHFTNDVGWGCMIRTSQSLLANTILRLKVAVANKNVETRDIHSVIDMFIDNSKAPFSLHNFISVAAESPLEVKPGEWFGPSAASLSIKKLSDSIDSPGNSSIPKMKVIISESCDLYDSKIEELFTDDELKGLLVLFPIRLGIDKINSLYHPSLLQLISLSQSIGIAGGKPSSSFYFLGHQDNNLIYLNPHFPQAISAPETTPNYDSYHTTRYQKLDINAMDPSMMIGILLFSLEDYENFKNECTKSSNKIVHFHNDVQNISNETQINDLDYKIDFDEVSNDDFININSEQQGNEDFIDLATEIKDLNDFSSGTVRAENVPEVSVISQYASDDSQDELINISNTISENYEHLDHSPQ